MPPDLPRALRAFQLGVWVGSRGPQDPGHWVQRRLGRGPREGGILSEADPRGQDGGPLAPPMPPGVRREHRRDGVLPSQGDRLEGTAPPTWQLNLGGHSQPPVPAQLEATTEGPRPVAEQGWLQQRAAAVGQLGPHARG